MTEKTLIFGSGPSALHVAENLVSGGAEIIIAARDQILAIPNTLADAEILGQAQLIACRGTVGAFAFTFDQNGQTLTREAAYAVIAEESERHPAVITHGLNTSERVRSLSEFIAVLSNTSTGSLAFSGTETVAFLTGLGQESYPLILEEIMDASLRLKSQYPRIRCYILTENLRVGAWGLEQKHHDTRQAGVLYIKFTRTRPALQSLENGCMITYTDEITGDRCRLRADFTVVDERVAPSRYVRQLAQVMELETDASGFVQADNVNRYIVRTNRRGIVAVGPARMVAAPSDKLSDAVNAALTIKALKAQLKTEPPTNRALINNRCTQCLTCFRVCPFQAIQIQASGKLKVAPWACERCGLCTVECPEHAITLEGYGAHEAAKRIKAMIEPGKGLFEPNMVAYCCERSAARAAETAAAMNMALPPGLKIVPVPCAGVIGLEYILSAFQGGADGVMVVTCHPGNCHSGCGNLSAHDKSVQAGAFLETIGFEKQRLVVKTLAANMSHEFEALANDFEKQILALGPSGLKR